MGIFFSQPKAAAPTPPVLKSGERVIEQNSAAVVGASGAAGTPQFNWLRLVFAIVLLGLIFGAGIYTAGDAKLDEWNKILIHAFQLLLGGTVGLIVGEAASNK
jgi:hypothetical protein